MPHPALENSPVQTMSSGAVMSGKYWVQWADVHAKNSRNLDDLGAPFQANVKEFIAALKAAGAKVDVRATRRDAKRAYLFHWSWLISLGKSKPSAATKIAGVNIGWDHGDATKSKVAAKEMVEGFGLAVPPKSKVAPALKSNHIAGKALDMDITWKGNLLVKHKDGSIATVPYMEDPNANTKLHEVGASYHVIKHLNDAPHWSVNGK
jgi:hypothetical protein